MEVRIGHTNSAEELYLKGRQGAILNRTNIGRKGRQGAIVNRKNIGRVLEDLPRKDDRVP